MKTKELIKLLEKNGVNVSAILQRALKQELHLADR